MRRLLAAALLLTAACGASAQGRFHFASADETRKLLAAEDDWLPALSPFNRAAIAGRPAVSADEFKRAVGNAAAECPAGELDRWNGALARVAARYDELKMALPATVTIACTDGTDAGGAPYTRGDTVFVPKGVSGADESLLAHELFHIFSRNHRPASSRLYALIGFKEAPALQWPAEWIDARISNPDAPFDRHTIHIDTPSGAYDVMPVLVARRVALRPGETFFDVLDVRLLAVERSRDGKASTPVRNAGQLVWFDPKATVSYLRQLGGNTGYTIHPEETAADNVMLLVTGRPARNPVLIELFRQALLAEPTKASQ